MQSPHHSAAFSVTDDDEHYARTLSRFDAQPHRQSLFLCHCKRFAKLLSRPDVHDQGQHVADFVKVFEFSGHERREASPFTAEPWSASAEPSRLLFLSGYPPSRWLRRLASRFEVDPDFFDRHLSFVCDDITSCDLHPSYYTLPSRQQTIFQTSIVSVCATTVGDRRYSNLANKRAGYALAMREYLDNLRTGRGWRANLSMVRDIEVCDDYRYVLHQKITILIRRGEDETKPWLVVWSDVGASLSQGPHGPWLNIPGHGTRHFRPVTLACSKTALYDKLNSQDTSRVATPEDLHQSASLIQKDYGGSLRPDLMASDPLYTLTELFAFCCASEAQYLDTIRAVLNKNINSQRDQVHVRNVLISSYDGLETRRDQIATTIDFLRAQSRLQTRSGCDAVANVIRDFEFLARKTQDLMSRCDHEWTVIMSEASVHDAQWSRDQSENQLKFTVLASIYLPLSVSASIFGMTFFNLETVAKGFTLWAVVVVFLFLFSSIMLQWDRLGIYWARGRTSWDALRSRHRLTKSRTRVPSLIQR